MTDIDNSPPIVLNVWDKDDLSDDYLGRAVIYLNEKKRSILRYDENVKYENKANPAGKIPPPQWEDIRFGFDKN